ncbi:hypothetical protein NL676_000108 [Syzygium grande]|nr:hypothetical protein NL676_000108 [Syzygium grande]
MEMNKLSEPEDPLPLQSPLAAVVAVAINGKRKTKYVVRGIVNKMLHNILFFVFFIITIVLISVGVMIPITEVREDVAAAYRKEVDWQTIVPESDDVASALAREVNKSNVTKLVIGASTPGISQGSQVLSGISQMFARPSSVDMTHLRCQSLDSEERNETITTHFSSSGIGNIVGRQSSLQSLTEDTESRKFNQGSISDALSGYSISESQANLNFELEKLRIELNHVRGMYEIAQSERLTPLKSLTISRNGNWKKRES